MDFQKVLLYGALGLVLMMLWQNWTIYQQAKNPPPEQIASESTTPSVPEINTDEVPDTPDEVTQTAPVVETPVVATPSEPSREVIVVETDLLRAEIDTLGGSLRRLELLQYPVSVDTPEDPFVLMDTSADTFFIAQGGLIGGDYPNHQVTQYQADSMRYDLAAGADQVQAKLRWNSPDGIGYEKVYTFRRDSYVVDVDYVVTNNSDQEWSGFTYSQFMRTPIEDDGGFFGRLPSYTGGVVYTPEEKFDKIDFGDMESEKLERTSPAGWVAMLQHYFVGVWLPDQTGNHTYYSNVVKRSGEARYVIGYKTNTPVKVAVGSSGTLSTRLFIGPKEQVRLKKQDVEGLMLTVDYGWLTPVAAPLFKLLQWIHGVVKNWGWAIIILTFLVKLAFYPLSAASYKSMAKMKTMQPRLKTLKERYGDDKQKLNQAMMEMYKKEKINPLGGCLPILIQIPVFIALYWVLLESVELRQADFIFWLNDLSLPDPYYVLPLIMGASMLAQQFLNPAPLDPIQKNIMMAMPVVFTVFFLWFPAGLVLYWVVNNILSIAQQWHITRRIAAAS